MQTTRVVIIVHVDLPEPKLITSEDWPDWVERIYVTPEGRLSVLQVMCPLGRGYFGVPERRL